MNDSLKSALLLALTQLSLTACATSVKRYDYPPTTNATSEIERLEQEVKDAERDQIDILAPNRFAEARKNLIRAKQKEESRVSNTEILETLGDVRAYLEAAKSTAPRAEAAMPEVLKARSDALLSQASHLDNGDLIDADRATKKTTSEFETGDPTLSVEKRGELQKKYVDVEITSIKHRHLDQSKALLEAAKKMDANQYANSTLISAETKYQTAERAIENGRHDTAMIEQTSDAAIQEAKHTIEIIRLAKGMKNQTPEELAVAADMKKNEADQKLAENARSIDAKNDKIQTDRSTIVAMDAEKTKLQREKSFNDAFTSAQADFTNDEAEVYRQGDNLVVRLKSMDFQTGRSELPTASLAVLSKVKTVISSLDADHVVIEGHADAVGSKKSNLILSEKRAETIATYLINENAIRAEQIQTKGYGDTRPLSTNKTKEGRAENRRVDVVITPSNGFPTLQTSLSSARRTDADGATSTPASR